MPTDNNLTESLKENVSKVKIAPDNILRDPVRLKALQNTRLLDSPPEAAFDRLTKLAQRVLSVPATIFSLVDDERQFFKSGIGLPEPAASRRETPLTHSFCQWVVATGEPLRVDDSTTFDLVCDNLAISELGVRAYLGVPIRDSQGNQLGAFAAIDTVPHEWTDEEYNLLLDFAAMAVSEIDLRLAAAEARLQAATAKAAEARLAESEHRYRTVLDGLSEVVFQTDELGRWTFLNGAWKDLTGNTVASSIGKNFLNYIFGEDQDTCRDLLTPMSGEGLGQFRQELRFCRIDGSPRWFEMRAMQVYDSEGAVVGLSGTLFDINERYEALKRLTESEVRFRMMVECLGEGLIITDLDDRIQYVNARMAEMARYTPRDMMGKRAYELLLPPRDWEATRERNRRRAAGEAERYELRFVGRDGQAFWVELHATPFFDVDGTVVGTLCAVSDISARKAAEQRLRETTAELQRSNQSLQEFASVASHDLQEPLRKIQAFGDRLHRKYETALGSEGNDYVARMQNAAGRMQALINDLLLFSRVSSKAQPLQDVDLNDIVRDVVSDLETRLQSTSGTVEVGTMPTLPGDPMQLRQLFQNVIGNALKFHRDDTPPVVRVHAELLGGDGTEKLTHFCRLSIQDNGIGFDGKYAERVFEVFERLHSRTEFEGTGMGLAICRRIVERHGGTIRADSEPGVGTTFTIDLPVYSRGEVTETINAHRDN